MTRGGDLVNVIPNEVRLETYVRGKTVEAIGAASTKVDRALKAGALALGATVEITNLPGYLPLQNNCRLLELFQANFQRDYSADQWCQQGHGAGSTDMGDLAHLMPALHPYAAGASGQAHGASWQLVDPYVSYVLPAKLLAQTAIDLLADDAREARALLDNFQPRMTKADYLAFVRRAFARETFAGDAL
jgi:metal-dependent amidase/aminoacylase/carboxypeptidase family protein